ncbi:response regulator [Paucibacter sp. TC2R-5]|uniref:ATP-binding protein n=1 Tax=Paucibacter sp. TC2R-5 TaxID=2893555 RepID=UPI0021E508C7|nr:ATP-binding protein [Paucibacter sp. TC2R-5]MCV2358787.1 response regulator [Paucibacter sp. TC2R-5]
MTSPQTSTALNQAKQRSLVTRLERILAAALAAALAIALLLTSAQEAVMQRAAVIDGSQAWLNTLAVQAASPLVFDDEKAAGEILRAASIYPGLQSVYILRVNGSIIASHLASANMGLSNAELQLQRESRLFENSLILAAPVMLSDARVGTLVAKVDLARMWQSILHFALALVLTLGLSGAAALLLARRFLRRALTPITGLKQVMEEVSQREKFTVRAQVVANDEVGALSTVFNRMLDQIVKRDSQLEDSNSRLLALKDAAEQASTLKSAFLAMMSHELRTPLAGILGMLKLGLRGQMEPLARERVDLASKNAQALLQIVNDLLDVSKIEAGKLKLETVDFALRPLLDDAMQLLNERAVKKSIRLELHLDPQIPDYLQGDPTRLRQVLLNLVGNAIKFTERGGVTVAASLSSPERCDATGPGPAQVSIYFAVQDSGLGISEEAQGRLFQKFEQADMSTTRNFGGTGLGLSICKQLVELMGGRIGLQSSLGAGSTFYFEVPFALGQEPQQVAEQDLVPHAHALHVLVAEDAQTNQLIIKALLNDMGHTLTLVNNGEQALQALTQEAFDLILMDGRMPVMDGLEATGHIRAGRWRELVFPEPQIPIIALTANASEQDRARFLSSGMAGFLSKPIDERALHQVLADVIEARRIQGRPLKPRNAPPELPRDQPNDQSEQGPHIPASPLAPSSLATPVSKQEIRAQRVRELKGQMLSAFKEQWPLRLQEIEAAITQADWPAAATTVHGIKGCLAFIEPQGRSYDLSDELERFADLRQGEQFAAGLEQLKLALDQTLSQPSS